MNSELTLTQVGASLLASPFQRLVATVIDAIVSIILSAIPFLGIIYFLLRDSLGFLDGQSVGKKIMRLRAVQAETGKSLRGAHEMSIKRSLPLLIPVLQLVDAFLVFSSGQQRLGDNWAKTVVIKEKLSN